MATFPSLISRIQQIINIAEKTGKFVFPAGRNMLDGIELGQELGFLTAKNETIHRSLKNIIIDPKKQIILTTGSE
jgi:ribonuclease J